MTEHRDWPEYDYDIPEVFDQYIRDLTGGFGQWPTINLPATFRWHEFWTRLAIAMEARKGGDGTAPSGTDDSAVIAQTTDGGCVR